jgi:hypothetical protein
MQWLLCGDISLTFACVHFIVMQKKKEYEVLMVELHGCASTVCVLHVVQLNISGVRVSFFQVTLFLQVPL